jgi:parvulin-like peptidyl-prolyl isomerase
MKRRAVLWSSIVIACVAGFTCAQLLLRSATFRDELAEFFDRGRLLALVDESAIYQVDLSRQLAESAYLAGTEEGARTDAERGAALTGLLVSIAAQSRASRERVSRDELGRQMNLLRFQFGDEKTWNVVLNRSCLSPASLATILENNLKARAWLEKRIGSDLLTTEDECRQFYDSHLEQFFLPERRNVSHLFLAAPPETAPDMVDAKKAGIEALSVRLAAGEDFAALVAQNSEDDATKLRGGELGYFSAKRMPPDFVEAATKLRPGDISKPVRTRLGFHILKLIDIQPSRQQPFDEVRGDISMELANQKRVIALEELSADLCRDTYLRRP